MNVEATPFYGLDATSWLHGTLRRECIKVMSDGYGDIDIPQVIFLKF